LRLDRLYTLVALRDAVDAATPLGRDVAAALRGEAEALRALESSDGGGAWWRSAAPSTQLTAERVWLLDGLLTPEEHVGALDVIRSRLRQPGGTPATLARAAAALATETSSRSLALTTLQRAAAGDCDLDALTWALAAARRLGDAAMVTSLALRLRTALTHAMTASVDTSCRGVHWLACVASYGDRAVMARAASILVAASAADRSLAAQILARLAHTEGAPRRGVWGSAEGDLLRLRAALGTERTTGGEAVVRFEGRELARVAAGATTWVTVREAGHMVITFSAHAGRALRVRVDGELPATAPTTSVGNVGLVRRIEADDAHAELVLDFTLPSAARAVWITSPLPAGYEPAFHGGALAATRSGRRADRWGFDLATWDGYALDRTPAESRAMVEFVDGSLLVRYARLRAGRHVLRVPVVGVATGRFRAAPASLRADASPGNTRLWAVTPSMELTR
jgi:hypothetical protein